MPEYRRRRRRRKSSNAPLIVLALVLALVLAAALALAAILGHSGGSGNSSDSDTAANTEASASESGSANLGTIGAAGEFSAVCSEGSLSATVLEQLHFYGTSDPNSALTVNGIAVERDDEGNYSYTYTLSLGENTIVFENGGASASFAVTRRYVVASFGPIADTVCYSGSEISVQAVARAGSEITVTLGGVTKTMTVRDNQCDVTMPDGYEWMEAVFDAGTYTEQTSLGNALITAYCDGITETYTTAAFTCEPVAATLGVDSTVTPSGGIYTNVGSGYICEIITYSAETFTGSDNDYSMPTNNYLPEGTVDYCASGTVTVGSMELVQLRCGYSVYQQKTNYPPVSSTTVGSYYTGTLPDHNEISVVDFTSVGSHSVLTLDVLWKAPFYFDMEPQTYKDPDGGANRNMAVEECTIEYIDITFCYATDWTGSVEIPEDNPIFSAAEVIRNESDYTLRLYLKQTGVFYGWDCYYNAEGQLCFAFLEPAQVSEADNAYGADLTGVTVMLDVGHGGEDIGAQVTVGGTVYTEAELNLELALAVKEELESVGATVVLNRSGSGNLDTDGRILALKNLAPDFCLCIHQNSSSDDSYCGFECYYFYPYTEEAASIVRRATSAAGIYPTCISAWHVYYVGRQTCCPVVLTENGYMSNDTDLSVILSSRMVQLKAEALAQGVVDYLLSIQ